MSMRRGDRVTEMYAFLTIDPTSDCEGIPSFSMRDPINGQVMMMPLVAADKDRVDSMRSMAIHLAKVGNAKLRLVKFSKIETLEELA